MVVINKASMVRLTKDIEYYLEKIDSFREEIKKTIIGQKDVVDAAILSMISRGHILLEGAPGLAKTLLVMSIARTVKEAKFQRIQFTPDLLPADITGITAYNPDKGFYTVKGPVFANFLLADEINRAPPKVQSAMLSVMQERQVVIGKETFHLEEPFFVMATQNPLEQQGTYPLPEAQIDRFLFKIFVNYPNKKEEFDILENNSLVREFEAQEINTVFVKEDFGKMQALSKQVYLSDEIKQYIVDIVDATRNPADYGLKYEKYVDWGGSPRASIALYLAGKAQAMISGRPYVIPEDIRNIAHDILRHRIILNYEGKAVGISTDTIISDLLKKVPVP